MFLHSRLYCCFVCFCFHSCHAFRHEPFQQQIFPAEHEIYEATESSSGYIDPVIFNIPGTWPNASRLQSMQMQYRVYMDLEAARQAPLPLVIMLPGNNDDCREMVNVPGYGPFPWDNGTMDLSHNCPQNYTIVESYRGFDYLGRELAKQGFAAVSIDPATINRVIDDNWRPIEHDKQWLYVRGRVVLRVLQELFLGTKWGLGTNTTSPIDFDRVGLMGHSKGAAGVRAAYNILMTPEQFPVPEVYNWTQFDMTATIAAVFEVAPVAGPTDLTHFGVDGAPWALLAAGCESDLRDYSSLRIVERQSRFNKAPNYFLSAYGANHEYFNPEWKMTQDYCLGDQDSTWNTSVPTFERDFYDKPTQIPLVEGSSSQREVLKWALTTFMNHHLKGATNDTTLAEPLTATLGYNNSTTNISGVVVGLANPNLATSQLLKPMNSPSDLPIEEPWIPVRTLAPHASLSFPSFLNQVSEFGLPPTIPSTSNPANLTLAPNHTYENALVIIISNETATAAIPLPCPSPPSPSPSPSDPNQKEKCEIHIDLARRTACYLPNASNSTARRLCASPREIQLLFRWEYSPEPVRYHKLKSRYNVEFGAVNVGESTESTIQEVVLLPISWETIVVPCSLRCGGSHDRLVVDIDGRDDGTGAGNSTTESSVYFGAVRRVWR